MRYIKDENQVTWIVKTINGEYRIRERFGASAGWKYVRPMLAQPCHTVFRLAIEKAIEEIKFDNR